ncbi:MAG: nucleotidyltransferase domain-containing protein [Candidatus Omnitrophica bacterium]|nr:nucleotidyltransferase domain-containing protein [Candidatus Omnitrophota bacterium]MBU0896737.1 nucleotidyltransferase domain-containing protein [Candidatus Omnitrophota bacterium]MBU1134381.1 nucleotidyltransferase domain-containing protein [Candidatus Omnitrophota bacterium]MBU1810000.1 nucleotidyltransferase domain-containing protein [Candidatus Omnitrophota bacterium]MBU2504214.1 nucleotidyltransferase domain-containing protein [Candidatus Omnitrophota bacterium]
MYQARSEIKEVIEEYKRVLLKRGIYVNRVILYGSYISGQSREDSDIDLVVVSDDFQKMNLRQRLEVLGIAAVRIMKPIEAQGYTTNEIQSAPKISFLGEILRVGVNV